MPHQCTTCNRSFADGSKEMLGGCPDCGGNKFQFLPSGAVEDEPERAETTVTATTMAGTNAPDDTAEPDDGIIEAPAEPSAPAPAGLEDRAQASARRSVVSPEELPPVETPYGGEAGSSAPSPEPDRPDLTELRRELNEQFESIKILQPGQYELNLMELYDREEYIIALEEDGRYAIEVPDTWHDAD